MLRILLINPPDSGKIVMERDLVMNEAFGTYAPLGLLYIATYLSERHPGRFDVRILDCQLGPKDDSRIADELARYHPDVVGLGVLTPMLPVVVRLLRLARQSRPRASIVIGGPHVTSFGPVALHYPEVDFGIAGYAEEPFARLMRILEEGRGREDAALESVPNLLFRQGAIVRENPIDNRLVPLDELPFPDRTLVEFRRYRCPLGTRAVMATLAGSRGCPFRCTFCNSPDKDYRARSIENILAEIRSVARLGIDEVFFFDDLFAPEKGRIAQFCEGLMASGLNVRWGMKARATALDSATALLMRRAGCERVHLGIEGHTDESLRALRKGMSIEDVVRAVRACREAGIRSVGSFMINLPGDTPEAIIERFRFAESLPLDYCQYAILVAYDHCEIFDQGVRAGQWDRDLWLRFARDPDPGFVAPILDNGIPRHQLDHLLNLGMRRFYLRPGFVLRRLRDLRSLGEIRKGLTGLASLFSLRG